MRPCSRPARRDRGAVIPLVAILLPVLITMTAFAVDLGSQRALRRQLQADADVIALDMVRLADGRTVAAIEGDPGYVTYVNESLTSNGVDAVTTVGQLDDVITFGTWVDGRDPEFVPSAAGDVPDAVEVVLRGTQDYRFMPGSGSSTRRAVATQDGIAVFSVGSRLASFSTDDSALLNPILSALFNPPDILPSARGAVLFDLGAGATAMSAAAPAQDTGGVSLDALSYTGLANANVALEDILGFAAADVATTEAGVASPEEILVSDIALLTLVEASADALAASGEGAEVDAAVAFLNALALNVDPDLTVNLGDLLGVDLSNPGAVLGTNLNLLDLLFAAAQVANEHNLVDLGFALPPGLFSSVPGLRDVVNPEASLSMTIVEGPQIGTGRPPDAFAETSQISLDLEIGAQFTIDLGQLDWSGLLRETELATINLALPISVDIAKARTRLAELICPDDGSPATMDLPTTTSAAGVVVGTLAPGDEVVDISSPAPITGAGEIATVSIAGRTVARVAAAAEAGIGSPVEQPVDDLAVGAPPYTVPTEGLGLRDLLESEIDVEVLPGSLLGFLLGRILNPLDRVVDRIVSQALEPFLGFIDEFVVSRLLRGLGVGVAGADVTAIDAVCDAPKLVD